MGFIEFYFAAMRWYGTCRLFATYFRIRRDERWFDSRWALLHNHNCWPYSIECIGPITCVLADAGNRFRFAGLLHLLRLLDVDLIA